MGDFLFRVHSRGAEYYLSLRIIEGQANAGVSDKNR